MPAIIKMAIQGFSSIINIRQPTANFGWYLLVIVSIAIGIAVRLNGLGKWPLAVDEYFIATSVKSIIEDGLPSFDCGGYYMRGLLYQYTVAPLLAIGLSPEYSIRIVTAAASLLALPPIYLLGKRLSGTPVASVCVILLSLSIWEIEFARFGRMYAPFQAVFLWYVWAFYRVVVDSDRKAHVEMYGLSLIGVLLWEGGIFLTALNFLPFLLNNRNRNSHLFISATIFFAAYFYAPK